MSKSNDMVAKPPGLGGHFHFLKTNPLTFEATVSAKLDQVLGKQNKNKNTEHQI